MQKSRGQNRAVREWEYPYIGEMVVLGKGWFLERPYIKWGLDFQGSDNFLRTVNPIFSLRRLNQEAHLCQQFKFTVGRPSFGVV